MRSLLSLLEEAAKRAASEVTIESGQPVVYTTARGAEAETNVLARTELFDMIVAAVDDAQQVELAVGNPVEFEVDVSGRWKVFAEPGIEGIRVRASRAVSPELSLDIQLDYSASAGAPNDFGIDPVPDIDTGALHLDASESSGRPVSETREDEISGDFHQNSPDAAAESGTWALEDDAEFDVGSGPLPDADSLPTGLFDEPVRDADVHIGVPTDDDDEAFDPFAAPGPADDSERRRTLSPTVRAMDAAEQPRAPRPAVTERELPARMQTVTHSELDAVSASERTTLRSMSAARPPVSKAGRTTISDGPRASGPETGRLGAVLSGLDELVLDIDAGTLVFVREPGLADALAAAFTVRTATLGDDTDLADVSLVLHAAPVGTIVIVRREDPSAVLGWILRRLEQGLRVFVETRARSVEGARRTLLGVAATDRAERWLDSHICVAVEVAKDGPVLVPA